MAPETLRDHLYQTGRVVSFRAEVAKMKATNWLNDNVVFVDHLGLVIDKSLLTQDQSVEDDDADE